MLLGNKGLYGASGGRAFDADTLAWQSSVVTNGGPVSFNELQWADELVFDLRACGAYPLLDDFGLFTAENQTQALTSFKKRLLGTAVNSPVYTPSLGFVNDGVSTYENTGYMPATHAVIGLSPVAALGIIELTNVSINRPGLGSSNTGTRSMSITPRNGTVVSGAINSSGVTATLPVQTSVALSWLQREDASTLGYYQNGVFAAPGAPASNNSATLPPDPIFVGCTDASGVPTNFRANTPAVWLYGAKMTVPQITGMYLAFQKYLAKHGQVI